MAVEHQEREEFEPGGRADLPHEDQGHPGPRQYIAVAVALAIVTLLEVAAYYAETGAFGFTLPASALVALLMIMMVIKFALVVLWFMHLRFDSPIYRRLFLAGLVLAAGVFLAVLLMFGASILIGVSLVVATFVLLGVFLVRAGRPTFHA